MKTIVMLAGLAAVLAFGTACFQMFSSESKVEACAGLSGQALIDCENRRAE